MRQDSRDPSVFHVKQALCPYCGYAFTAVGTMDGTPVKPSPGDFSCCLSCVAVLQFAPDLSLQKPGLGAVAAFALEDPEGYAEFQAGRERNRVFNRLFGGPSSTRKPQGPPS